jgi:hypothetical protein
LIGQIYEKNHSLVPDSVIHLILQDSLETTGELAYIETAIIPKTGGRMFLIDPEITPVFSAGFIRQVFSASFAPSISGCTG